MTTDKTLADVQPGGRVRLGDGLPPCPFCGHSDFDQWPCEYIDASGANVVRCAHCHAAAPMKVWHDLSAQPSPGGQGELTALVSKWRSEARAYDDQQARETGYEVDWTYDAKARVLDRAADEIEEALAALQSAGEQPMEMRICELRHVSLKPNRFYIFTVDANCANCRADAAYATGQIDARPAQAVDLGPTFQAGVAEWMGQCFLPSLYSNMTERGDRLLEEVLELLQAHGYDRARVPTLVDYVFGRPVGEPVQEVGGVMVTLAGYCWVAGLDMHAAGDAELARISQPEVMAKIRAKQEAKNALHFDTPLPGNVARQPVGEPVPFAVESKAFETHAASRDLNLVQHPLHYLFLDPVTVEARRAWKAALAFAPPAQAVDMGEMRKCADEAVEFINHGYGGHARRKIQELLALIDSRAVGNG